MTSYSFSETLHDYFKKHRNPTIYGQKFAYGLFLLISLLATDECKALLKSRFSFTSAAP